MKVIKKGFLSISILLFFINMTCEDDGINIISDNLLIGSWVEPIYDGDTTTFKRANGLPEHDFGILFKPSGDFVERSSGWCGTPPLSFSDYNGTWVLDNTLVTISQESYPSNYAWRIISLTENELVVKRELTNQEKDYRELMDLFDVIYNLSISFSCTNEDEWTFTAYGSKACGGPQGYIAYSNQIDVQAFLNKIEAYTQAEKAYNTKWGIISTCDVPNPPKSIECSNGYPMLKY